jgi:membrane associated rhomboid family serine protease
VFTVRPPIRYTNGFRFIIQLFSEIGSLAQRQAGGGVAYMAHIGGIVFGIAFARLFESRKRLLNIGK